jgi:DNA-binding CsgD family transcriptional regulator
MSKQTTIKSAVQQNWRRSLLMGLIASILSLMLGVLLQTAFYEVVNNFPPIVRQDAHITLPLCDVFPDLYGCEPWVGALTSLEIWELSQQVGQIGGLLLNLILMILFSMWVTIRIQSDSLMPALRIGVAGFFTSLILAMVIHVPLSVRSISGVLDILLLLLLPLNGLAGGQIGKIKLSRQLSRKPPYFLSDLGQKKVDGVGENLSERELDVLVLVAEGFKNREIAQQLHISNATVKTHLQHIFAKLGVSNRTAAVTQALACGFLHQRTTSGEEDN